MYILLALLGIGLIIFLHELGHYLAARKVGVRVERFALGFDPPFRGKNLRIFSFRRGDTEYVLGAIPFGGYVKLAGGEGPLEPGRTPAPDELPGKSVGQRAQVFAAGALMNILSAFVFFILAFTIGVSFSEPRIGDVKPGSPAWKAGIQPGDKVVAIDGKAPTDYSDLIMAAALGGGERPLQLKVERRGLDEQRGESPERSVAPSPLEFSVRPIWDAEQGFFSTGIGFVPAPEPGLFLKRPAADSPAAQAGVQEGDRLVGIEIEGVELPPLPELSLLSALDTAQRMAPGSPARIKIRRGTSELWLTISARRKENAKELPLIQVLASDTPSGGTVVRDFAPGSTASQPFRLRDQVVAVNDETVGSLHWLDLVTRFTTPELRLQVRSWNGELRDLSIKREDLLVWILRREIRWGEYRASIGLLDDNSPLAAIGVQVDDTLFGLGDSPLFEPEGIREAANSQQTDSFSLRILRGGQVREITVSRSVLLKDNLGVTWRTFPALAVVIPGGPADKAGIRAGSRILRMDGQPLYTYEAMREFVNEKKPSTSLSVDWVDSAGKPQQGTLSVGAIPLDGYEPSGLELREAQVVVHRSLLGAIVLGVERTIVVGKRVFLTLRSLLRREVSPKNLSGPVGITHIFTVMAERGISLLIYFMAIVSVNLGLLNLLPFPILDGGHLLFLGIEKLKGSPVNVKVQEWASLVAFFVIIGLALFVTFNDLTRLFR
jgi:RIP metalloprotease RseP